MYKLPKYSALLCPFPHILIQPMIWTIGSPLPFIREGHGSQVNWKWTGQRRYKKRVPQSGFEPRTSGFRGQRSYLATELKEIILTYENQTLILCFPNLPLVYRGKEIADDFSHEKCVPRCRHQFSTIWRLTCTNRTRRCLTLIRPCGIKI